MNEISTVIEFEDSIIGNEWQINEPNYQLIERIKNIYSLDAVSYTHLRAHET